ncbi:hypothetical protein [Nonomuraea wenchangensis]|uniref:hypothetical protein n=1 Tax=Nonomuraea wenchangensis TaxID=568860 RepID=UPI00332BD2BA
MSVPPLGTPHQGRPVPARQVPGVDKGQPLCLIGDSGTGKSHLLIALGTEAADEKVLAKTIARYGHVDLLCIDELG